MLEECDWANRALVKGNIALVLSNSNNILHVHTCSIGGPQILNSILSFERLVKFGVSFTFE